MVWLDCDQKILRCLSCHAALLRSPRSMTLSRLAWKSAARAKHVSISRNQDPALFADIRELTKMATKMELDLRAAIGT